MLQLRNHLHALLALLRLAAANKVSPCQEGFSISCRRSKTYAPGVQSIAPSWGARGFAARLRNHRLPLLDLRATRVPACQSPSDKTRLTDVANLAVNLVGGDGNGLEGVQNGPVGAGLGSRASSARKSQEAGCLHFAEISGLAAKAANPEESERSEKPGRS